MGGPYSESYHRECRDQGHAMTGVMSTLSSVVLTVHLIMNIINANNNNNNVSTLFDFNLNTDLGSLIGNIQCGNVRIFLPLRFYVNSILVILKPQKLPI